MWCKMMFGGLKGWEGFMFVFMVWKWLDGCVFVVIVCVNIWVLFDVVG